MILASEPPLHLILTLATACAYGWTALRARSMRIVAARTWVLIAWILHASVLGWTVVGQQPYFGFAPALSLTAWVVAAVFWVETQIFPQLQTRWALCSLGTFAVLLAYLFPGTPLPPTASPLLAVHLALGIASYGLLGIAVVHAWFMSRAEQRIRHAEDPHSGLPLLTLERLTFRFVEAGFVLLSATLLIGIGGTTKRCFRCYPGSPSRFC